MAVSTINPWSAGAVQFNVQPWEAFYERQALRQQAKNDALENYFKDLNKNITSSGMRSQDVPTLLQKQQEWQQLGIQNKDKLLNPKLDNGQTLMDYQRRYNEMQGLINESKDASKSMDAVGKMKLNPQMSYVFDDPHIIQQIQSHELPIGDPNRQGINLATLTLPPQPITTKDLDAYNKYLTGGVPFDKVPGQIENIGGFKTRTPIYQQFSHRNLQAIGDHAAAAYDTDSKWRRAAVSYFDELKNNPEEYKRANTTFKSIYGGDIDDPKEAWIAKGILDNNMKATHYETGKDEVGMALYLDKMRTANDLWLAKEKKKIDPNDTELNNAWLEGTWRNRIAAAKAGKPDTFADPNNPLQMKLGWKLKIDPTMAKAFAREGREPYEMYVTPQNEIYPIFHQYKDIYDNGKKVGTEKVIDRNGNAVPDPDYSQPMDLEQALITSGVKMVKGTKEFNRTMSNIVGGSQQQVTPKAKYPLPSGQHRTIQKKGTNFTYTWNENTGKYE